MIRIPISKLESGMVLAAPLRHPRADNHVLLEATYVLDETTIAQLRRFSIDAAWVEHPGFGFLDKQLGDAIPQSRMKLYESIKESFTGISKRTAGSFDLMEYRRLIADTILTLVANKDNAVWAERIVSDGEELFSHCANVAYLSLVIGLQLKDYVLKERRYVNRRDGQDLSNLGIGAMLHDLGKLGLEGEWQEVHFMEPQANCDEYRSHAERGYQAVQGRIEASAAQIVLHHHQRFDGGGFPQLKQTHQEREAKVMKGRAIHIFSRVAAAANTLDGLISVCERRKAPVVAALWALQGKAFEGMFDPWVLDTALRWIPPYPLGSYVELSDGRVGVVTDLNHSLPCQPKVGILPTKDAGNKEMGEEVDLAEEGAPGIVKHGDHDVGRYFYAPAAQRSRRSHEGSGKRSAVL